MSNRTLSESLAFYRNLSPDEWEMDDFLRESRKQEKQIEYLTEFINEIITVDEIWRCKAKIVLKEAGL